VQLEVEVLGGYPRSDRLRKLMRQAEEAGGVSEVELRRVLEEDTILVVGVQLGSGMTRVVDGMLDWHDPLRPFVAAWRGVALGGLQRWFDNNFFYRVPVIVEPPDAQKYVVAPRVRWLRSLGVEKVKAVLPGPCTFAKLSQDRAGMGFWKLVDVLADLVAREASLAIEAGADVVQIDEPMLGDVDASPSEVKQLVSVYNEVAGRVHGRARIAVPYRAPSTEVWKALDGVRVEGIVLDAVDTPKLVAQLLSEAVHGDLVGLGVIEARNIYLDPYDRVRKLVEDLLGRVERGGAKRLLVTTSAWLDLIPFKRALEKTRILGLYARRLAEELGLSLAS
jgi:5-methyltetrahydropteroyltriglutamate--homocysteine methyltransferase